MYNLLFCGVWRRFRTILASFSLPVLLSIYNSSALPLRNIWREIQRSQVKLARIVLKRLQTPQKRKLYTQQEKVSRFSLILNYSVRSLYFHTGSYNNAVTQCHVDGSQRSSGYLWIYNSITETVEQTYCTASLRSPGKFANATKLHNLTKFSILV